jgi:hypothetical protein
MTRLIPFIAVIPLWLLPALPYIAPLLRKWGYA